MCIKGYFLSILSSVRDIYFRLKWKCWGMLGLLWVILPAMNFHDITATNEYSRFFVDERILHILPLGITAGSLCLLYSDLSEGGRELFYINRHKQIKELLTFLILYFLLFLFPYVIFFDDILNLGIICVARYFILCGMFVALAYFLAYFTASFFYCTLGVLLMYLIQLILGDGFACESIFSWNYYDFRYGAQMAWMLLVMVLGLTGGYRCNLKYLSYD